LQAKTLAAFDVAMTNKAKNGKKTLKVMHFSFPMTQLQNKLDCVPLPLARLYSLI
jgi:hypothetical protein